METVKIKLKYLKDVLGIKQVLVPEDLKLKTNTIKEVRPVVLAEIKPNSLELLYQIKNPQSEVLFVSLQNQLNIEEMQLLEKIIVALKIPFQKTDVANLNVGTNNKLELVQLFQANQYRYVFLQGEELAKIFTTTPVFGKVLNFEELTTFTTFHPKELMQNADLKKEAWEFFKKIIPTMTWKA